MKKIIGICNTPLILFTFINLINQIRENKIIVDVVLTDESVGMETNADRIKKIGIFRNVYFIKIKDNYKGGNLLKKVKKIFYIYNIQSDVFDKLIYEERYDEFFYCLNDIISNQLYYILKTRTPLLKTYKFEEGYTDYVSTNKDSIIKLFLAFTSKFHNKGILERDIDGYYTYHPEWIHDKYYSISVLKKIVPINKKNESLIDDLNTIFGYSNQATEFQMPYVFLEESFSIDKAKIDDFAIIKKIVNIVGNDNIIIKPHPRNDKDRFTEIGVRVSTCRIPWEIIMLNGDFSNTIFISISSGSIVNSIGWGINTGKRNVLVYKLLKKKPILCNKSYEDLIERNIEASNDYQLTAPMTQKELTEILK